MSGKGELFRLTVDIPSADHVRLKALAAVLGKSMREIITEWIHGNLYKENTPNAATLKAMKDIDQGKNLVESKDIEDLFRNLGI